MNNKFLLIFAFIILIAPVFASAPSQPSTVPPNPVIEAFRDKGITDDETLTSVSEYTEWVGTLSDTARDEIMDKLAETLRLGDVNLAWKIAAGLTDVTDALGYYSGIPFDNPAKQDALIKLLNTAFVAGTAFLPLEYNIALIITEYYMVRIAMINSINPSETDIYLDHKQEMQDAVERDLNSMEEGSEPSSVTDTMSDLDVANACLGFEEVNFRDATTGEVVKTELGSTQSNWDYLRTLDLDRAEQIAEKIEINEGTYYPEGSADEFRNHIPAGNAAITTHSPVYVTITDSSGRKLGFNPEDKKVICEDNYSFCSSPSSYSDVQMFLIQGLMAGDYNIQLIGFEDGDFEIFFMAFNSSGIENVQDINGSVKKGDVLSADFSVIKNNNNSFEITPISFEKVGSDYDVGGSPESVPFEVLSISPQNNTLFNDEKPVISVKFNNEISDNNSFNILKDENGNFFTGIALINARTLTFIPSAPLQSGNYTVIINNLIDESGSVLDNEMLSSFQVIRGSSKGIEYKLSSPKIYNLMERIRIENNNTAVLTNIKVRLLFPENDYPNLLVEYVNSSIKPVISSDSYGNEWAYWEIPSLAAGGELLIESNFTILVFDVDYFDYVNFSGINDSMPAGYELFTQPNEGIESNNALIIEKANEIVEETDSNYVKAEKVYEWVRNNIEYMYSGEGVPGGALQTLTVGKGTCYSYATLYAALLRALGIPTKYIISFALDDTADSHAYNEFYLSGYGWVPVDATWAASFNDWFLSSDTTHIRLGELWPPERGLWVSYTSGSFPVTSELSIYETLNKDSLWDNTSKKLYDAADALSFKEKILEDLPDSIRIAVANESNAFSASYVREPGIYAELLNNKDNETLIIQEAAKAYFNSDNETADALLAGIPESIYNQIITECSNLLDEYLEDLNNTKNIPDWENYEVYMPYEEESLSFGYMFNQSLTWLVWADGWLALGNYSSTQSNLEWAVYYIYWMNEAKAHIDYDYEYSNYYSNKGEELIITLSDIIITFVFFAFVIFSAVMLINCLFRGKFRHLNKILWLLIIIITWGFGAVPYFFLEYRKK